MNKSELILYKIIDECDKHIVRIDYAYKKLENLFPLELQHFSKLDKNEIAFIDQYIYRFSKLQDSMGQKLFKAVLNVLDENTYNKSAIDIFNRLDQLEIIGDYDTWKSLRDLRNELAHEYEDDDAKSVELLNLLYSKREELEKYFYDIKSFLKHM